MTGLSRRAFVRNTALVGGGSTLAVLLSGCTVQESPSGEAPTEAFEFPADEVPVGGGVVLREHSVVLTQPEAGVFHAFSAVCTHQGCLIGRVEDRGAYCGCHSSYFDIRTGEPVAGPADAPLPEYPVTVNGDTLSVG